MIKSAGSMIQEIFGGVPNFILTIITVVTGVTSHLDTIEQLGKIISEGLLIISTTMIIVINFAKAVQSFKDGLKKLFGK